MTRLVRLRNRGDDGFAMMYALFLMLVVSTVVVAISALIVGQSRPTQLAKRYIRTINGAQAGLQNTLTAMRNATTSTGGDPTKLPCSEPSDSSSAGGGGVSWTIYSGNTASSIPLPGDPVSGTVSNGTNSNDGSTYSVSIVYFALNPVTHQTDASWLTANALHCAGGYVDSVPLYALVQSQGQGVTAFGVNGTSGNRVLQGIYQFKTSNLIKVGGRIGEFNASAQFSLCMDAGSNPGPDTQLYLKPCQALGYAQQLFTYRNDLTIFYGGAPSLNLCLWNVGGTPKLETCYGDGTGTGTDVTYPYHTSGSQNQMNEEWAFNDSGHFQAPDSSGNVTGNCLQPNGTTDSAPASSGTAIVLTGCSGGTTGYNAWNPDPQVGAGASLVYYNPDAVPAQTPPTGVPEASPTQQMVNFAEFGRCLDVTGQDPNADHLIDYPCKQSPNQCYMTWNQIWNYRAISGAYGIVYTDYASGRSKCASHGTYYCLTEPTAPATYITISPCQDSGGSNGASFGTSYPSKQMWKLTGAQLNYASSYQVVSQLDSRCMAADPSNQVTYGSSTIVATSCDGSGVPSASSAVKNSLLLKWNAPPAPVASGLQDVHDPHSD